MPKETKNKQTPKTKKEPKIRPIEELEEMSIKSMTGHEAKAMVTHLREKLILSDNKITEYQKNIEATREKEQQILKNADAMETFYRERLAYINNITKTLKESVDIATKGLVN